MTTDNKKFQKYIQECKEPLYWLTALSNGNIIIEPDKPIYRQEAKMNMFFCKNCSGVDSEDAYLVYGMRRKELLRLFEEVIYLIKHT